jgi:hypothetical protein
VFEHQQWQQQWETAPKERAVGDVAAAVQEQQEQQQ